WSSDVCSSDLGGNCDHCRKHFDGIDTTSRSHAVSFTETCEQDPQVRHGREHARERGDEREPRELRAYGELEDVELRDESDRRRQPREREQQRPERYHEERTPPRDAAQVAEPRG